MTNRHFPPILADEEPRCRPVQDCPQQWGCLRKLAGVQSDDSIVTDYSSTFVRGALCKHFLPVPAPDKDTH